MWSILAPWVDDTITTAYTKGKSTSLKASAFLTIHNRTCTMILPMDKVEKVVPIDFSKPVSSDIFAALTDTVTSSNLGAAMYSCRSFRMPSTTTMSFLSCRRPGM